MSEQDSVKQEKINGYELGERMKAYEKDVNYEIDKNSSFIIRLDGKKFSVFTSKLLKNRRVKTVYDKNFCDAMVKTMNDLIEYSQSATGYTHSDEITLIFRKCQENQTHLFNGKQQKLVSIMASYCGIRFYKNFMDIIRNKKNEYSDEFLTYLEEKFEPVFDARILVFTDDSEIVNHMIWRSVFDCYRNCIQSYCYKNFSKKESDNKNVKEMLSLLISKGVISDVEDIPFYYRHGVYGKKIQFTKEDVNPFYLKYKENPNKFTQEVPPDEYISVLRTQVTNKSFKISQSQTIVELLLDKYWKPEDDGNNNFTQYNFDS